MLSVTKIFHFETAHAIHGYSGPCRNIHGHSYELHVTVTSQNASDDFLKEPGFVIDFKDVKKIVNEAIVEKLDHKLILSEAYIAAHPQIVANENIEVWKYEPTAENILLHAKNLLLNKLPAGIVPLNLKLFETKNSYAEWNYSSANQ